MQCFEKFSFDNPKSHISNDDIINSVEKNLFYLQNNNIRVNPSSRIMMYYKFLKKCNHNSNIISLTTSDLIKYHQSLFELDLFNFITDQFKNEINISPWNEYFQEMFSGNYFPQFDELNTISRNKQFELYIGSLLKKTGYKVSLEEPDLTFEFNNNTYSIAAKKIKSSNQISKNVKKAIKQIDKCGIYGIIALDISQLFNPDNYILITYEERGGLSFLEVIIENFIDNYYKQIIKSANNTKAFGLLIFATTLGNKHNLKKPSYLTKIEFIPLREPSSQYYNILKNLANDMG